MKIIKQGQNPIDRLYHGTCQNCGTQVEFTQAEGKITYDQRDGDYISVQCPTCREPINVAKGLWVRPSGIEYDVRDRA